MRNLVLMLAACTLALPALAADHEVSVELGTLANRDPDFDLYSQSNVMPSRGLRAAFAFHERVAVVAGWHRVRRGAELYDENSESYVGRAAFFADELTLGIKADVELVPAILPYVSVQGMLVRGLSRFDDDPEDEESPGQVQFSALAPGLLPMGGVELRIPKGDAPFTLAWHIEAGYGLVGNMDFDALGDVRPGGFALRSGVGVRF